MFFCSKTCKVTKLVMVGLSRVSRSLMHNKTGPHLTITLNIIHYSSADLQSHLHLQKYADDQFVYNTASISQIESFLATI